MATLTEIGALIPTLHGRLGDATDLVDAVASLNDAEVVAVLDEATSVARMLDQIKIAAIGVVAARSTRDRGHAGLAQRRGSRSAADLVQKVVGSTKGEAAREVRVGLALVESASEPSLRPGNAGSGDALSPGVGGSPSGEGSLPSSESRSDEAAAWHEPLRRALNDGTIAAAQFDAIRGGLGEPPVRHDDDETSARGWREAWRYAAEHLIAEAPERTVEELRNTARTLRDQLDPEGADARFHAAYEARAFRQWRDADGRRRASITFDDEGGAFVDTFLNAALRPRRGGPRFVDADEKARAATLANDTRSNDQLAYDLILDVMRAGVLADAESVFGTRQAGVRLVQIVNEQGQRAPVAYTEDGLTAFPAAAAEQHACTSGYVPVTIGSCGKPLDVGREQRLFTPRQRIALAIRDGGCRWQNCDQPASYCEAHHIDSYSQGGRTDIDRGILLCRYHHMTLHHGGWRITREGTGDFILRHPSGDERVLRPRIALVNFWRGLDVNPPPQRFRPTA